MKIAHDEERAAVVVFGTFRSALKLARKRARAARRSFWIYRDMDAAYADRGNNVWAILPEENEHPDLHFQCVVS